jgi:hypothetical protein
MDNQLQFFMDEFGDVQSKKALLLSEKEAIKKKIIPLNIQAELEELDAEFSEKEKALEEEEKQKKKTLQIALDNYINTLILKPGEKTAIKSPLVTVHISAPVPEWEPLGLDGYALNHPEILMFRKDGKAGTRIVRNKL